MTAACGMSRRTSNFADAAHRCRHRRCPRGPVLDRDVGSLAAVPLHEHGAWSLPHARTPAQRRQLLYSASKGLHSLGERSPRKRALLPPRRGARSRASGAAAVRRCRRHGPASRDVPRAARTPQRASTSSPEIVLCVHTKCYVYITVRQSMIKGPCDIIVLVTRPIWPSPGHRLVWCR